MSYRWIAATSRSESAPGRGRSVALGIVVCAVEGGRASGHAAVGRRPRARAHRVPTGRLAVHGRLLKGLLLRSIGLAVFRYPALALSVLLGHPVTSGKAVGGVSAHVIHHGSGIPNTELGLRLSTVP